MDYAIRVENLTKVYKLYEKPIDRLKEALNPFGKKYHKVFYALKNISFEVKKGETIGIIGKNGAGKSTLLKVITGILIPTSGKVEVNGKIASLLELGAGFNPEMTGIENIYLQGTIMGFSKEEIDKKIDEIISFADIGEFIYQPVKTYSSGMFARLAFATAINVEPDILIVDEALSVGDMKFQNKCIRKMEEMKEKNLTILFVSHDTGLVNVFCDKVLWIDNGFQKAFGDTKEIIKEYISYMAYGLENQKNENKTIFESDNDNKNRENYNFWESTEDCEFFGEGGAKITHIAFIDGENNEKITSIINTRNLKRACVLLRLKVERDISLCSIGFLIKNKKGQEITGLNNYCMNKVINNLKAGDYLVKFSFKFPILANGKYSLSASIAEGTQKNHIQLHWVHDAYIFEVISSENECMDIDWVFHLEDTNMEVLNEMSRM